MVVGQENLRMMMAESHFAIGQFDETVALLKGSKSAGTKRGLELCSIANEKMGDYQAALDCSTKLAALSYDRKHQEYELRIARLYEELGQGDKAVRCYEQILSDHPDDASVTQRLAALAIGMRNYHRAQQLLQKAVALPGAPIELKKMLAQSLTAQGNRMPAINWFKLYLETAPNDTRAWYELGTAYYEQEHYAEAIEALKKSVALEPKNEECLATLGACYVQTKDLSLAAETLEKARTINKSNLRVLPILAECYRAQNDTKKLMAVLRDWAVTQPKNAASRFELGDLYIRTQNYRDALPYLQSACDLDSQDAKIHVALAKCFEKGGNDAAMLGHLKRALICSPSNAEAQFEFGKYLSTRNQRVTARQYFAKSVAGDSNNAAAQFEYGKLLCAQGDRDSAYVHLLAAVQLDPFNADYLVQFADVAYTTNNKNIALDMMRTALRRDSLNPAFLQWAGILYKELASTDTARQLLLKAIVHGKSCASCFKNLGDIYLADGEYDMAVKFYNQALDVGSFSESAALGLGAALFLSNDLTRAKMILEKVLSQNSRCDEALYRLCSTYLRAGFPEKAAELVGKLGSARKNGWMYLAQGEISEARGDHDEALIAYSVANTLMPENALTYASMGRINLNKKQYEKAVENFGTALGKDPHNSDILIGMGKAYEGLSQNPAAFDLYAEAARRSPRNAEPFYLMGNVLANQNQHEQSVASLLRGIALNPKDGRLYFCLGNQYKALSKFQEAIHAYKKSMQNRNDETRFFMAYKEMGNIYCNDIKDPSKAKECYKKYLKAGGKDETRVQVENSLKS
jgi:tetratricopeptide (TPR) repeat protein